MYPLMLSLVAVLAFAGTGFAQTKHSAPKAPTVLRDTSAASPAKKTAARPVAQKASIAHSAKSAVGQAVDPAAGARGPLWWLHDDAAAPPPPPLDTTSPRTLSLVNVHTDEALTVTYWSDGAYRRDALDKLNHFLRDSREDAADGNGPAAVRRPVAHPDACRLQRHRRGPLGLSFAHHQRLAGERQPRRGQRQPAHERQRHGHPHARRAGVQDPAGRAFARHGRRRLLSALGLRPYRYRPRALLVGTMARIEVVEGDITRLNKNGAQPIRADRPTISARKTVNELLEIRPGAQISNMLDRNQHQEDQLRILLEGYRLAEMPE